MANFNPFAHTGPSPRKPLPKSPAFVDQRAQTAASKGAYNTGLSPSKSGRSLALTKQKSSVELQKRSKQNIKKAVEEALIDIDTNVTSPAKKRTMYTGKPGVNKAKVALQIDAPPGPTYGATTNMTPR